MLVLRAACESQNNFGGQELHACPVLMASWVAPGEFYLFGALAERFLPVYSTVAPKVQRPLAIELLGRHNICAYCHVAFVRARAQIE